MPRIVRKLRMLRRAAGLRQQKMLRIFRLLRNPGQVRLKGVWYGIRGKGLGLLARMLSLVTFLPALSSPPKSSTSSALYPFCRLCGS